MITLAEAKTYLRIDDPVDVSIDAEIQGMVDAAIKYMEKKTGYIWENGPRLYHPTDGCVRIYDTPVTGDLSAYDFEIKNGYILVHTNESVLVNVGYIAPSEPPAPIKQAALQLLKYWFYESEKQTNDQMVPDGVHRVIELYKRFVI